MSIWDTLSGRKTSHPSVTTHFDPSSAQDASSFLSGPAMPDPSLLHPLAGLNQDTLDYLSLEDSALDDLPGSRSALPSRGWSDDLSYGTGTTYLTALSLGGLWGLVEGLKKTPVTAPPKLRLNGVLNSITRRGPFLGNSAGVIAMVYNGINSTLGHFRGKHDAANSILAGAMSGMLFKSTRGLRPMMISGGIVASIAGAWALFSSPGNHHQPHEEFSRVCGKSDALSQHVDLRKHENILRSKFKSKFSTLFVPTGVCRYNVNALVAGQTTRASKYPGYSDVSLICFNLTTTEDRRDYQHLRRRPYLSPFVKL
ncbi:hypothetical protein ACO22_06452 [Paracoccidioides brasiliensis]|uniref:Mitochondrial import inner membrane translocase subunit TIM23 n=1 Tax=Paracoccidioides brasiliensis TaxID=121759 RepID=A0A1D2J7H9_PARBR|nr:hypothetical protein ACO22_06452 [Paracoccidioides brasiliensis]